jgi:hypothetical protein
MDCTVIGWAGRRRVACTGDDGDGRLELDCAGSKRGDHDVDGVDAFALLCEWLPKHATS